MKVRLGDICEILNGYAFKSSDYTKDGIRIIRISNVQKGFIEDSSPVFYPKDNKYAQNYALIENDLLISLTGNVGRVALISRDLLPAALNQRVACIRIKDKHTILTKYLFHLLNSDIFEHDCIISAQGIAQKNMSTSWLQQYEISIDPLETQSKRINVLDTLDSLISRRKRQLLKLDQLVKSRFMEMFGEWPANSKNWPTGQIKDIVIDVKYGSSRPSSRDGKYPYLRMNNITYSGQLDLSDIKKITIPDNELENCSARKGDVLFNRTNSRELVGKTCVYNQEQPMVIAGFIIRVRLNETLMSPVFLSSFLNTDFSKHMLMHKCKSAIGQANINAQEMKNIKLYIPPLPLQQQFAAFVEKVDKSKFIVGARLAGRFCRKILTKLSLSEADYD